MIVLVVWGLCCDETRRSAVQAEVTDHGRCIWKFQLHRCFNTGEERYDEKECLRYKIMISLNHVVSRCRGAAHIFSQSR